MAKDPASRRQINYLRILGASESELDDLDRQQASLLIDRYKARSKADRTGQDEERSGCLSFVALLLVGLVLLLLVVVF